MPPPVKITPEARDILLRGCTARQLGQMFALATTTVEARVSRIKPVGERGGLPIYRVYDAAPHLTRLPADVVERVIRTNHADLPPLLKKEYWQGQQAQLLVKKTQGDLWDTQTVIEYVGAAFRDIRTEIMLMADAVERDAVLTEPQRETIEGLIEGALRGIQGRLRQTYRGMFDDPGGRDAGRLLDPEPEDPAAGL